MSNELTGIGGYASLMKTQKNPYDRNIASTQAVMNSMPKDGGVTGLEGLGRLPLMYAMGQDTANAQQFDDQRAVEEQQTLQGIMDYQREKSTQEYNLKLRTQLSEEDYKKVLKHELLLKQAKELAVSGNEGEAVKLLNDNGIPVKNFKVLQDGTTQSQADDGSWWSKGPQGVSVWDATQNKWMPPTQEQIAAASKMANRDENYTISGGYSNGQHATFKMDKKTGEHEVIGTAPIKVAGNGAEGVMAKQDFDMFKRMEGDVRRLEQVAEQGYKGQIIIDGTVHSFDGSKESQQAVNSLMQSRRAEVSQVHPELTKRYHPNWISQPATAPSNTGNVNPKAFWMKK